MKQAPRVRGGLGVRLAGLLFGLTLFAAAIVVVLESRLGLAPWDVLHQGIATRTPLTFGQVGIAVGLVILCVAWALGQPPGWGTLANAVLVGVFIDAFSSIGWVDGLSLASLPTRSGLLFAGVALFGVGSAFYIGAGLGAGPRDSMMLVLARGAAFASASYAPRSRWPSSPSGSSWAGPRGSAPPSSPCSWVPRSRPASG